MYNNILKEKYKNISEREAEVKLKTFNDYMERLKRNQKRWACCYTKQTFSCGISFCIINS